MTFTWSDSQHAFVDAATWFLQTATVIHDQWEQPGLGEWDIRALVGHTSRSLITVENYLEQPADHAAVDSTADYFRATHLIAAGADVTQRGRDAGTALGSDPKRALATLTNRVTSLVAAQSGDELITTIAGGMRLRNYLPTRTFELAVHTADLARALNLPLSIPPSAARQALSIASDLSLSNGTAGHTLLLLTGRESTTAHPTIL